MADLGSFLAPEYGICIEENIIAHILWADDLVLLSDSEKGMQNQLDGLLKFCSLNQSHECQWDQNEVDGYR